jgi:hypothetical protein
LLIVIGLPSLRFIIARKTIPMEEIGLYEDQHRATRPLVVAGGKSGLARPVKADKTQSE